MSPWESKLTVEVNWPHTCRVSNNVWGVRVYKVNYANLPRRRNLFLQTFEEGEWLTRRVYVLANRIKVSLQFQFRREMLLLEIQHFGLDGGFWLVIIMCRSSSSGDTTSEKGTPIDKRILKWRIFGREEECSRWRSKADWYRKDRMRRDAPTRMRNPNPGGCACFHYYSFLNPGFVYYKYSIWDSIYAV